MSGKIFLRRCVTPRRVQLPNRQSFLARYKRVSRQNLPRNVTITRIKRIGPKTKRAKKAQKGRSMLGAKLGVKTLFKKGVSTGSKALSSEIGKKLIDKGIKHAPELYKLGASKIKNKSMKKALESDVADYIVKETQKK